MEKLRIVFRNMFLTLSVIAFLSLMYAGCKQPSKKDGNKEVKVTITVQGDENVASGKGGTFEVDKGTTWQVVKAMSQITGITFKGGFELSEWKLDNDSGAVLTDTYAFNAKTTVFAVSKPNTSSQDKVTITVDGDENVASGKGGTFEVDKGTTWGVVKIRSEIKDVAFNGEYFLGGWKLNDVSGDDLEDDYVFDADQTIFAVSAIYVKVAYADLGTYLEQTALELEVNYIELIEVSADKLKGNLITDEASELAKILSGNDDKIVGLKLPKEIEELKDMSLCFKGCTNLQLIANFPQNVIKMNSCFKGCENLVDVGELPEDLEDMARCFESCKSLVNPPIIPENVDSMIATFRKCENLVIAPSIPETVTTMRACFDGCLSLTTVTAIPEYVEDMSICFASCKSLKTAPKLPSRVEDISGCFLDCVNLTEAPEIPKSVKKMGAFLRGCTSITQAPSIPKGVEDISECFNGCSNLITAPPVIPPSVKTMVGCFSECIKLVTVPQIKKGVTTMEAAFYDCRSLKTPPKIPEGVVSMYSCFNWCSELESMPNIPKTVTNMDFCFQKCENLVATTPVPEKVVNLLGCFKDCTKLTEIVLDCKYNSNDDSFGDAFKGCTSLKDGGIKVKPADLADYKKNAAVMGTTEVKFSVQ